MENVEFYNEEDKVSGTFIEFKTVGDKIEGTLIGVSEKDDNFNPGEKQKVYELKKCDDGSIALIGGRPVIDPQMKNIRLGQIIAVKFEGTKPPKVKGYNPTKTIQVYAPKNAEKTGPLMDNDWIQGQTEANLMEESVSRGNEPSSPKVLQDSNGSKVVEEDGEIKVEEVDFAEPAKETAAPATEAPAPATEAPAEPANPNKVAIDEIKALAVIKLNVSEEDAITKTMEATGLAIIAPNFEKIKEALNAM